ncbi:MAG: hypothetical protein ABIJ21_01115 [Nanoarchaeota archaeon]
MKTKKTTERRTKVARLVLFLILFLISFTYLAYPIAFQQDPDITPSSPHSNDSLNCTWIAIDDAPTLLANITWYNNSIYYSEETDINCTNATLCRTPQGITGNNVFRGNIWNCTVTIFNSTVSINKSDSINISNADPVMAVIDNVSVLEDVPYSTTAQAPDAENDTLIWFSNDANFTNDLFTIDSSTGQISFTAEQSEVGNHTMDIIVIDGQGGSDAQRVIFNIIEVDDPPQFNVSLSNQSIDEGDTYYRIISATDEENNNFNFTLNASSLVNLTLIWINNYTANLTFSSGNNAPGFADTGNHTVNLTVYETANTSVNTSTAFNLEINPVNHDPILTAIPNQNATQGNAFVLNLTATDLDPSDTLTFSISTNCTYTNPWTITTSDNSTNATGYINLTLNNTHVICRWVNISVTDTKTLDWQVVFMNITNTNDAPIIYNISTYAGNTAGQNVSNLTKYYGTIFTYKVNATDLDMLTYENDTITFASNDSRFAIDNATGIITFEVNQSIIGNYTVNITATDLAGANYSQELLLYLLNNTIPNLTVINRVSCLEDIPCEAYIEAYDPDAGENLTFTSNDTTHFPVYYYNVSAARFNITPTEDMVANYTILVTVADNVGAEDNESFTLEINNTNDAPFFDRNQDNISDTITFGLVVETYTFTYLANATDYDLRFGDNLTFNATFIIGDALFNITKSGNRTGIINFTPNTSNDGNYSVNISVTDIAGATDWQIVNFTVYNVSQSPIIGLIKPYYNTTLGRTVFDYENASQFPTSSTNINFTENTTVIYNATAIDPDGTLGNLSYIWYRNGTLNTSQNGTTNNGYNIYYGFFDNGIVNITLVVRDGFSSTDSFSWIATIANVNRQPLLLSNPPNLTGATAVNTTVTLSGYFSYYDGAQRFLDPDNDLNGNNKIQDNVTDPDETFSMPISASTCDYGTITTSNGSITIIPLQIGTCIVTFTATDEEGLSVSSSTVRIDIGDVPVGETSQTPVSSSGGGGTTTRRIVIPKQVNVDVPKAVELVVPGRVIMYENQTMRIPIILRNTWNGSISGISLSATTNNSYVNMTFSQDFISSLAEGEETNVTLSVNNYRENGPYEIYITANVTDPLFSDTGTVFINSIQQADAGQNVEVKIAFARDILTANQECQELNELLDKAEQARRENNIDIALNYVDSAVNGCKFLISQRTSNPESPSQAPVSHYLSAIKTNFTLIITGTGILVVIFLILLIMLKRKEIEELRKLE